jgi:hypothetical protein
MNIEHTEQDSDYEFSDDEKSNKKAKFAYKDKKLS